MILEENESSLPPSKSQRKREAHALQSLGKQLTTLSEKDLARLPITDEIRAALSEYNRLPNSHGAKRRQLQFIGKLMRDCDLKEIETALEAEPDSGMQEPVSTQSPSKVWRDRILQEGEDAIESLVRTIELADRQKLRQLLRNINHASESSRERQLGRLQNYLDSLEYPET